MKIKKDLLIKGQLWTVDYKWRLTMDGVKVDGLADPNSRLILLDRLLPVDMKPVTFLHELNHAILFESHLLEAGGITEFQAEIIAQSVAQTYLELFDLKWKRAK